MRFVAYWDRWEQYANIGIDDFELNDSIITLFRDVRNIGLRVVGSFDTELLDAWYVSEG